MALREIFATFGFSYDKAKLTEIGHGIDSVKHKAKEAGESSGGLGALAEGIKGLVAGFIGGEVVRFTNEIAEQAAELKDLSLQTGLATNDLQAWKLEAQLSGANAGDFTTGLRKLSRELATGVDETGQQSKLFKELKISAKNAEGGTRDLAEVLPEIAEKFKGLTNGAQKSALAQQLFGRAGTRLVPLLSKGAEGIAEMKKQFEDLGGGFSEDAIDRAKEYDDSLTKLQFSFLGFKSLLATGVFPALSDIVGVITKASVGATGWLKETTLLGNGVKTLAAILTGKLLVALAPFLLPGLKFVAIFLAVDDLIAFLQGKSSVIGLLLNSWFGNGTATVVRNWCNDAAGAIKGTFIGALDLLKLAFVDTDAAQDAVWKHFTQATNPVVDALDSIFAKIKLIYDAFTDWDTLTQGVKELGDAVARPFESDELKKSRQISAEYRATHDAQGNEIQQAKAPTPATAALANAYDNIANGAGQTGPIAPIGKLPIGPAPVTNYISPVNVEQTFGAGTGPEVKKLAKDAARAGVKEGLADYRAGLQDLEQRAP